MPTVTDADRALLDEAAELPGALYGARLYSMTALMALAEQRERYEREIAALQGQRVTGSTAVYLSRLTTLHRRWVALAAALVAVIAALVFVQRPPKAPTPAADQSLASHFRPIASPTLRDPQRLVAGSALPINAEPVKSSPRIAASPTRRNAGTARAEATSTPLVVLTQARPLSLKDLSEVKEGAFAPSAATHAKPFTGSAVTRTVSAEQLSDKRSRENAVDAQRALRAR